MNFESQPTAAEQTRHALVITALRLFGSQGFDGTSTRQIAAAAKANIGSIAYHFGGKDGLRMAAADHVVATIQGVAAPVLGQIREALDDGMPPDEAIRRLGLVAERMVGFVAASPQAGEIVLFVLQELGRPSAALDRIYAGLFEPIHRQLCLLWERATGEAAESEGARLAVFTLVGQAVYFRIGREAVLRRMDWKDIGPLEAERIVEVVRSNLDAMVAARRGRRS